MPYRFIIADRKTHNIPDKTWKGNEIELVASQPNPRVDRKGKDSFIYRIGRDIYYNHDLKHNWFIPMAKTKDGMRRYYGVFCGENPTPQTTEWLARNHYNLV